MSRAHDFVVGPALFFKRTIFQISGKTTSQRSLKKTSRHRVIVPVVRVPNLTPTATTISRKRIRNNADDGDHYANQCIRPPLGVAFSFNSTAMLVLTPTATRTGIVSTDFTYCHKN